MTKFILQDRTNLVFASIAAVSVDTKAMGNVAAMATEMVTCEERVVLCVPFLKL